MQTRLLSVICAVLFWVHLTTAWGYWASQKPASGWTWQHSKLPSHGFLDSDARRRPNQWVLSHHEYWESEKPREEITIESELVDGSRLWVGLGDTGLQFRCEGETLFASMDHIGSAKSNTPVSCVDQFQQHSCDVNYRVSKKPEGLLYSFAEGQDCLVSFQNGRDSEQVHRIQVGVRPVLIQSLNSQIILHPWSLMGWGALAFLGAFLIARTQFIKHALFASFVFLLVPLMSPEFLSFYFRAPYWNHWGIGIWGALSLSLVLCFVQYSKEFSTKTLLMFSTLSFSILAVGSGNNNVGSIMVFGIFGSVFGVGLVSIQRKSQKGLLLSLFVGLVLLELGTRMTKTGLYWLGDLDYALQTELTLKGADTKNWDNFIRDWADFESGQFQKYPTRAYPVSYLPKEKPIRVVCMGGSSTGGAYQFDDLNLFYPAILEQEGAGKFEVINQGVGGWTSYHMRRYLSHHLESLQPTILTFYIGNNDAARYLPADVEHLFEAMESASNSKPPIALSLLGPLRKVFFLGWMTQAVEAVPPEKLQHNLLSIASQMSTTNRKILLMTELNHPNSKRLRFHHRRLKTLAENNTGIELWDLTKVLPENTDPFFLDQSHLTVLGHQWLGESLYKKLRDLGWLEGGGHE